MARTWHGTGHAARRLPVAERRHRFKLPDLDHHVSTVIADYLLGQAIGCLTSAAVGWAERLAADCHDLAGLIVRVLFHLL